MSGKNGGSTGLVFLRDCGEIGETGKGSTDESCAMLGSDVCSGSRCGNDDGGEGSWTWTGASSCLEEDEVCCDSEESVEPEDADESERGRWLERCEGLEDELADESERRMDSNEVPDSLLSVIVESEGVRMRRRADGGK